ncbi:MAG TPA: NUDIX domain-containing protein [Candidatus Limnocylindria bacterium]|nr:NUDIX domain-containing protein [Candidatus Limnocylindria bacterium]
MPKIDPRLSEIYSCLYRVSLKAVIVVDGKLLMTHERSGWYNLPGGGLDYGEETKTALLRELEEELGLLPRDLQVSTQVVGVGHKGSLLGIPWFNVYYRASVVSVNAVKEAELQYKWVAPVQLKGLELSPAIEHDRNFLLTQF